MDFHRGANKGCMIYYETNMAWNKVKTLLYLYNKYYEANSLCNKLKSLINI